MYIFEYYLFIAQALITACICGREKYTSRDERIKALYGVWARNSPVWSWNCQDLIERGDKLSDLSAYHEALTFYNKAVEKKPTEPSYYRLRGRCHKGNFNYEEALAEFQKAISVAKKNELTEEEELRVLDESELIDLGEMLQRNKNPDGAIWCFNEAIRRNPNRASNYSTRGNCYMKHKLDWDKAISDFKNAKKLDPTVCHVETYYLAEMVLNHQRGLDEMILNDLAFILDDVEFDRIAGRFEGRQRFDYALLCYTEAIKKSRYDPDYFRKRGLCHFKMGNWDEARKDLQENLRLDPNDKQGQKYLIKALFHLGKHDDALKIAQALSDVELYSIGQDFEREKGFKAAITFYTEALKKNSSSKFYYIDRSRCHKETGNLDAAITDLKTVLRMDPNDLAKWTDLIKLFQDAGREDEIDDEIIGMDYPRILGLAHQFLRSKNYDRAMVCYDLAIKKNPKKPEAYESRADCYRSLEKFSDELTNLEAFINLSPTPPTQVLLKRAEALVEVKKLDEAKVALKNLETKMNVGNHELQRIAAIRKKINKIEFENNNG